MGVLAHECCLSRGVVYDVETCIFILAAGVDNVHAMSALAAVIKYLEVRFLAESQNVVNIKNSHTRSHSLFRPLEHFADLPIFLQFCLSSASLTHVVIPIPVHSVMSLSQGPHRTLETLECSQICLFCSSTLDCSRI